MNNYKNSVKENLEYIKNKNKKIKLYKDYIKSISYVLVPSLVILILFNFILGIAIVKGQSMAYNFHNNDLVLFNRIFLNIERKDVVVINKKNTKIIKRIIGIPGDTIDIINNSVYLNNVKLDEQLYTLSTTAVQDINFPVTLEKNEYFVLGDNRDKSIDSRSSKTGIIIKKNIIGKVFFLNRIIK